MRITLEWTRRWRSEPIAIRIDLENMYPSDRYLFETVTNYLNHLEHLHAQMDYDYPNSNFVYEAIRNAMDTINQMVMTYEDDEELYSLLHSSIRHHSDFDFGSIHVSTNTGLPMNIVELLLVPPFVPVANPYPLVLDGRDPKNVAARAA
jgi:hypothetical protein